MRRTITTLLLLLLVYTLFEVKEVSEICYAHVEGFWSELGDETDVTDKVFKMADAPIGPVSLLAQWSNLYNSKFSLYFSFGYTF